ncbi:MAG: hypothetical protein ABIZ64_04585, partial [Casimicrobium sp.]
GSYGLMPIAEVISPAKALPLSSGRAYPPRFALMMSAANHLPWDSHARTPSNALLVVSSLLPTYAQFAVTATANGVPQRPLSKFANTAVFRCNDCGQSSANWDISVQGGAPESTSITVLAAPGTPSASASLSP